MEKDTVILSLTEYNELRDLRQATTQGKTLLITVASTGYNKEFISNSEAVEQIANINFQLAQKIDQLDQLNKLRFNELVRVKKMSYWQFLKWKKS